MTQNKIVIFIFCLLFLVSIPARADSVSEGGVPSTVVRPVSNQTKVEDSKTFDIYRGQSRAYEDANQEYAKIALYEYDKLTMLQGLYNQFQNETDIDKRAALETKVLKEIHLSCPIDIREDLQACFPVYKSTVTQQLRAVRKYNLRNSDMVAKLRMPLYKPVNGSILTGPFQVPGIYLQRDSKLKDAIIPNLKTVKDMKKEVEKLKVNTTETYRQYAKELLREPNRDDYIKYKAIPRNPSLPEEGGKLFVLDTSCGKDVCIDEKAYLAAQEKFQKDKQIQARLQGYQRDVAAINKSGVKPDLTVSAPATSIQEQAYKSTRELMAKETNKMIRGKSTAKEPELKPGEEISVVKLPQSHDDREYRLTISPDLLSEKTLERIESQEDPLDWFQKSDESKFEKKK